VYVETITCSRSGDNVGGVGIAIVTMGCTASASASRLRTLVAVTAFQREMNRNDLFMQATRNAESVEAQEHANSSSLALYA